jgi:hypothetical protein
MFRKGFPRTLETKVVESVKDILRFSKKLAKLISTLRNGNSDFTNGIVIATVILTVSRLHFFLKIFRPDVRNPKLRRQGQIFTSE